MPNGICPKCLVNPVLPKRSYCRDCGNAWQSEYKKTRPRQTFTREQRDRQLELARQRFARMTPEEKAAYRTRREATRKVWIASDPAIREAMNLRAVRKRATWSVERREREKQNGKAHYARRILRASQGLCGYSMNCNEPPIGVQRFCLWHWCNGLRQADQRLKAEYTTDELVALWLKQEGKCAITGIVLVAGDTAHIDHILPVARGGTGIITNVRFVHRQINSMKWDYTDDEFKAFILSVCPQLIEWAKK